MIHLSLPGSRVACAVAILFCVCHSTQAQVYSASLEELAKSSSSIVLARAVSSRSFWNEQRTQIHTEVTIDVEEPISGAAEKQTVITIPGGRVGNTMYEVSDMPVFVEGEEVLVFLWQDPSGRTLVTGGAQGKLQVFRDDKAQEPMVAGVPRERAEVQTVAKVQSEETAQRSLPLDELVKQIKDLREE